MRLSLRKLFLGLAVAGLVFLFVVIALVIFLPRVFGVGQVRQQPVAFSHITHVTAAGIQCTFCHRGAETGAVASIPPVALCMTCHRVVGRDNPEVQKVVSYWERKEAIQWVRVHRLPDSVHFVHEPHIRAGLTCATCHGDVGRMALVRQVRSLRMGDCLACHRERQAPTECSFCHY